MKILIIGGAGFIGSHLCEAYSANHDVTSIDNYISGKTDNHIDHVEYINFDAENILSLDRKFDIIFHLGEYSRVEQSLNKVDFVLANNSLPILNILKFAKKERIKLTITSKPLEAATGADCVMTDKWVSMNDKVNKVSKKKTLKPYQVNKKLMSKANSDAVFMHCLPVGRGEEVTNEVIDGKQSVVWRQALNRVHAQKSIIKWCLD